MEENINNEQKVLEEICRFETGNSKILSCRIESNDQYYAFGCEDGNIRIFKKEKSEVVYKLFDVYNKDYEVSCLRWKPNKKNENLLVSGHIDGSVMIWHVTSKQMLKQIKMKDNPIYAIDFNSENQFCTGGQDTLIRVYDLEKLSQHRILDQSHPKINPHSNRIFALKFIDDHTLLSAGWDQMMLLWDIRTKAPQQFLYGLNICGDSLDVNQNLILTASYTTENQIKLYDLRIINKLHSTFHISHQDHYTYVYAAQFNPNQPNQFVCGTTGFNTLNLFNIQNHNHLIQSQEFIHQDKGVYSLDFNLNNQFIYSGDNGMSGMIQINQNLLSS